MKKSLILVGMLAVGYANAQEGNVGINTETPKATLEVLPSAKNLAGTTNEGIVAPKLTKTRIANIAEANLVEGTLVYATDATYTGNNTKVAKITEKGYYFYNGTEWVKAGADMVDQLWVQRTNGNITETYLKPADEKNTDLVAYLDNGNGIRNWRLNIGNVENTDLITNFTNQIGTRMEEVINGSFINADAFPKRKINQGSGAFFFNQNVGVVKESHASLISNPNYYGSDHKIIAKDVLAPINNLYGSRHFAEVYSNNNINNVLGLQSVTHVGVATGNFTPTVTNNYAGEFIARNYAKSTNIFGLRAYANNFGEATNIRGLQTVVNSQAPIDGVSPEHTITSVRGIQNHTYLNDNATLIGNVNGIYSEVNIGNNITVPRESLIRGTYNRMNTKAADIAGSIVNVPSVLDAKGTKITQYVDFENYPIMDENTSITNYIAYSFSEGLINNDAKIENMYGLRMASVTKGANNYAIYTNRGKVSLGDQLHIRYVGDVNLTTETPSFMIGAVENYNLIMDNNEIQARNNGEASELMLQTDGGLLSINRNVPGKSLFYEDGNMGLDVRLPSEKLDVNGNIRSRNLRGTGNRNVYADKDGILRAGDEISATNGIQNQSAMKCDATNAGKINYTTIQIDGEEKGIFGFCMQKGTEYVWAYMVGGANIYGTSANGAAFGDGL